MEFFTPEGTIVGSLHTPTSTAIPTATLEPASEKTPQAMVTEGVEPDVNDTPPTHSESKPVGNYVPPRSNPLETPILDTLSPSN